MSKFNSVVKVSFHVLLWTLLFFLTILFLKNYSIRFNYFVHVITWLLYVLVFYITYFILMKYFFKKEWVVFLSFSFLLLLSTFIVREYTFKRYHEYMVSRNEILSERPPFYRGRHQRVRRARMALQRGRAINSSYGVLIFYLLAFSFRLIEKWQDDEKQKMKLEKDKVSTELSFLKQQINPHFLFNSLNSIYSLSISKSETTPDSILKLSSILRYVLYESEKELVFLSDELQTIKDYIELQKLRLTEMVSVNFKVEGIPENHKIEPLLLIPIIENAFKYGVDNIHTSFININIKIVEGKLELDVSNKIVAKTAEKKTDSGIGIKNIKRRLDLLHGTNYKLDIKEENDVFTVYLQLNLKS